MTTPELQQARVAIKNAIPALYDAFWSVCDAGDYFDTRIPLAPSTRLRPRNLLLRSGTTVLRWAYRDVIERAAMSLAAESVAEGADDPQVAAYLRFVVRNREATDAIRAYLRFLDQVSYHLYEVSGRALPAAKTPRGVSFARLEEQFRQQTPLGSRRLLAAARHIVAHAHAGLTVDSRKLLESFRNVDTHRFVVGIDHIVAGFGVATGDAVRTGGRLFTLGDPDNPSYALFGEPDLPFALVDGLLKLGMRNAHSIIAELVSRRLLLDSA